MTKMKSLLKLNSASRTYRDESTRRFHASGLIEEVGAAYPAGNKFTRALRTAQLGTSLSPAAAWTVQWYSQDARDSLFKFPRLVLEEDLYTDRQKSRFIRALPETLECRLGPCFDSPEIAAVWDPDKTLRLRYQHWRNALICRLDNIDFALHKGQGAHKLQFKRYAEAFWELYPMISELMDDIVHAASGGE